MEQLWAGQRLDRYELIALLGQGGQGTVWRVRDVLSPQAPRALKLIDLAAVTPEQSERARREARQLAALSHPSIVACHGLFEDLQRGLLGLVTSFVQGRSLRELLGSQPGASPEPRFDQAHRLRALEHLADAMRYLHERSVVHRDIKLDNVMLGERFFEDPDDPAQVQLIDFGIAVAEHQGGKLTRVGHVVGTAPYLAPELLDPMAHGPPSAASGVSRAPALDVFAFGVVAWALLVGGHPTGLPEHAGLAEFVAIYRQLSGQPERWLSALEGLPSRGWLSGCLALDPAARVRSGVALRNAMAAGRGGAAVPITLPLEPSGERTLASSSPFSDVLTDELSYAPSSPRGALAVGVAPAGVELAGAQSSDVGFYDAAGQRKTASRLGPMLALVIALSAVGGAGLLAAGVGLYRYTSESLPALSCQPGEPLAPQREFVLWVDPPLVQEHGITRRFAAPGETVCLTNRRTRQRQCVTGGEPQPTVQARVADTRAGSLGLEIELRRGTQPLLRTPPLGFAGARASCLDSEWLLNVEQGVPGLVLLSLQLRPR